MKRCVPIISAVAAAVALSCCATASRPASSDPTLTTPPSVTATPADIFGPDGYRSVKLGMSTDQVLTTGLIEEYENGSGPSRCLKFPWRGMPTAAGGIEVSPTNGVVLISAPPGARTTEGIGNGSTHAALTAAYPELRTAATERTEVRVPGNPNAVYSFVLIDDKVHGFGLRGEHIGDC